VGETRQHFGHRAPRLSVGVGGDCTQLGPASPPVVPPPRVVGDPPWGNTPGMASPPPAGPARDPSVSVFAPMVSLSTAIEPALAGAELHLHPGGQGFWIAQMVAELGVTVSLVAPFGGESGVVLQALIAVLGITVYTTSMAAPNVCDYHDLRSGELVD